MASLTTDEVIEKLKAQLIKIGSEGVMSYLQTQSPFFSLPVVKIILSSIVRSVIEIAIRYTELGAFFLYVDQYTNVQVSEFVTAMRANIKAQESGTDEEKKKAEADLIAAARGIIKFAH